MSKYIVNVEHENRSRNRDRNSITMNEKISKERLKLQKELMQGIVESY
jgi:hypothetical protein